MEIFDAFFFWRQHVAFLLLAKENFLETWQTPILYVSSASFLQYNPKKVKLFWKLKFWQFIYKFKIWIIEWHSKIQILNLWINCQNFNFQNNLTFFGLHCRKETELTYKIGVCHVSRKFPFAGQQKCKIFTSKKKKSKMLVFDLDVMINDDLVWTQHL